LIASFGIVLFSYGELGYGIDKILIVAGVRTRSDSKGLAMRLRPERRSTHVRDPNLDRA